MTYVRPFPLKYSNIRFQALPMKCSGSGQNTNVGPRSLAPFNLVNCYTKCTKTSWTYSTTPIHQVLTINPRSGQNRFTLMMSDGSVPGNSPWLYTIFSVVSTPVPCRQNTSVDICQFHYSLIDGIARGPKEFFYMTR